jgi:hypothetical protein
MKNNFKLLMNNNSKMKKANKLNDGANTFEFCLPDAKSKDGELICVGADDCLNYCYINKGFYLIPAVQAKHEKNYDYSKQDNFINMIQKEIDSKRNKITHVRVHSGGDFYNKKYLFKWLEIAKSNEDIIFYCYTKSIPLFKKNIKLIDSISNFKYCYSLGGKFDFMINKLKDNFSKVFQTKEQLINDGFVNASDNDFISFNEINNKIGLIYH